MFSKRFLLSCHLSMALCGPSLLLAESATSHLAFPFTDSAEGELPAGNAAPWRISSAEEGAFRPTIVMDEDGQNALHVKSDGKGSISFSTRTNPLNRTQSLQIHSGSVIEWSFEWKVPGDGNPGQTALVRLDDGSASAGHFLAGLAFTKKGLAHLIDPEVEPISRQMAVLTKNATVTPGKWYQTSFRLEISADGRVASTVSIQEKGEPGTLTTESATFTPSALNPDGAVRVVISVFEGTDLLLRELQLRSL